MRGFAPQRSNLYGSAHRFLERAELLLRNQNLQLLSVFVPDGKDLGSRLQIGSVESLDVIGQDDPAGWCADDELVHLLLSLIAFFY